MSIEKEPFLIPPKKYFYKITFRSPFGEEGEVEVLIKEDTREAALKQAGEKHNVWEHEQEIISVEKTGETN